MEISSHLPVYLFWCKCKCKLCGLVCSMCCGGSGYHRKTTTSSLSNRRIPSSCTARCHGDKSLALVTVMYVGQNGTPLKTKTPSSRTAKLVPSLGEENNRKFEYRAKLTCKMAQTTQNYTECLQWKQASTFHWDMSLFQSAEKCQKSLSQQPN